MLNPARFHHTQKTLLTVMFISFHTLYFHVASSVTVLSRAEQNIVSYNSYYVCVCYKKYKTTEKSRENFTTTHVTDYLCYSLINHPKKFKDEKNAT
jgi:hypothetical protein